MLSEIVVSQPLYLFSAGGPNKNSFQLFGPSPITLLSHLFNHPLLIVLYVRVDWKIYYSFLFQLLWRTNTGLCKGHHSEIPAFYLRYLKFSIVLYLTDLNIYLHNHLKSTQANNWNTNMLLWYQYFLSNMLAFWISNHLSILAGTLNMFR